MSGVKRSPNSVKGMVVSLAHTNVVSVGYLQAVMIQVRILNEVFYICM